MPAQTEKAGLTRGVTKMRFPLVAMTAVAVAFATSNANAMDDIVICHFAGHTYRMETKVSASDSMSGEYDVYHDGSYLGPWHYQWLVENKAVAMFPPDRGIAIGSEFPVPGSITSDQPATGIPMAKSLLSIRSTKQQIPGDCTVYAKR
jgi:hypothetical protein